MANLVKAVVKKMGKKWNYREMVVIKVKHSTENGGKGGWTEVKTYDSYEGNGHFEGRKFVPEFLPTDVLLEKAEKYIDYMLTNPAFIRA